jgi:hypothetical protein
MGFLSACPCGSRHCVQWAKIVCPTIVGLMVLGFIRERSLSLLRFVGLCPALNSIHIVCTNPHSSQKTSFMDIYRIQWELGLLRISQHLQQYV